MKKSKVLIILAASVIFSMCKNGEQDFPDFDTSTVYFAYQSPVRTITLGREYSSDNTLDNAWQCQIMATVGGFREVKKDIEISFVVDNSMVDGKISNVEYMPTNYYELSDNKIVIQKSSKMIGGVTVQLKDAFFNDPLALKTHYVIPLRMTGVTNADGTLSGVAQSTVQNPNRLIAEHWEVLPKDYILYGVKFINKWDAIYLRRGRDNITRDGVESTEIRRGRPGQTYYVEHDEVMSLKSLSLNEIEFIPTGHDDPGNVHLNLQLKLNFDQNNNCSITAIETDYTPIPEVRVYDVVVSGNGKYVENGEKNSWGYKDRDGLYLDYQVEYKIESTTGAYTTQEVKYVTKDTLVIRDRAITSEFFTPVLIN